jgi:hypothetical protein
MIKDELLVPIQQLGEDGIPAKITINSKNKRPLLVSLGEDPVGAPKVLDQTIRANIQAAMTGETKSIKLEYYQVDTGGETINDRTPELVVVDSNEGPIYRAGLELVKVLEDKGLDALLESLSLPNEIKDRIFSLRQQLDEISTLTYARKAKQDEAVFEGRGVYVDVPLGNRQITLYLKGVGSQHLHFTEERDYPGYPNRSEDLFFDNIHLGSEHPRIVGTESLRWGLMEYVNLHVLLDAAHQHNFFDSFDELIDRKIPFPVALRELPELTHYMQALINPLREQNKQNPLTLHALNWEGLNENLVITTAVVPGKKRFERESDVSKVMEGHRESETNVLLTEERARVCANIKKVMLRMGIIFSSSSSHGQNIYDSDSPLPLADYSDFLFLGNYQGGSYKAVYSEGSFIVDMNTVQDLAVYLSMSRYDGQRPPVILSNDKNCNFDDVVGSQKVFLTELLEDLDLEEGLVNQLAYLYLFIPDQLDRFIAKKLRAHYSSPKWDEVATLQKDLTQKVDTDGKLMRELEAKVADNVSSSSIEQWRRTKNHPIYACAEIAALFDGNASELLTNPYIGHIIQVAEQIAKVENPQQKQELAEALQHLSISRKLEKFTNKPFTAEYGDTLYLFEYQHMIKAMEYLKNEMIEEAIMFLRVTANLYAGGINSSFSVQNPEDGGNLLAHIFAERLLEAQNLVSLTRIDDELNFILFIEGMENSATKGLGSLLRTTFQQDRVFDIYSYCGAAGYTNPHVLFKMLCREASNAEERTRIISEVKNIYAGLNKWLIEKDYDKKIPLESSTIEILRHELSLFDELDASLQNKLLKFYVRFKALNFSDGFTTIAGRTLFEESKTWIIAFLDANHADIECHYEISKFKWLNNYFKHPEFLTDQKRLSSKYREMGFSKLAAYYGEKM